ncbi:hypothetical protein BESB_058960 [Besnoitia besnoiti]|uniref:Uncharacterized protein n=1 Tax=Besnoitia besnoiti TaxID=94643 RepID=A0A2A9MAU9_BESBE|nr:hypothetical protein BESB_058960 [Besnoitia besnoiti]PFH35009.1 hypothetical protein BESB_058960 [Besnoitia besnoiti]
MFSRTAATAMYPPNHQHQGPRPSQGMPPHHTPPVQQLGQSPSNVYPPGEALASYSSQNAGGLPHASDSHSKTPAPSPFSHYSGASAAGTAYPGRAPVAVPAHPARGHYEVRRGASERSHQGAKGVRQAYHAAQEFSSLPHTSPIPHHASRGAAYPIPSQASPPRPHEIIVGSPASYDHGRMSPQSGVPSVPAHAQHPSQAVPQTHTQPHPLLPHQQPYPNAGGSLGREERPDRDDKSRDDGVETSRARLPMAAQASEHGDAGSQQVGHVSQPLAQQPYARPPYEAAPSVPLVGSASSTSASDGLDGSASLFSVAGGRSRSQARPPSSWSAGSAGEAQWPQMPAAASRSAGATPQGSDLQSVDQGFAVPTVVHGMASAALQPPRPSAPARDTAGGAPAPPVTANSSYRSPLRGAAHAESSPRSVSSHASSQDSNASGDLASAAGAGMSPRQRAAAAAAASSFLPGVGSLSPSRAAASARADAAPRQQSPSLAGPNMLPALVSSGQRVGGSPLPPEHLARLLHARRARIRRNPLLRYLEGSCSSQPTGQSKKRGRPGSDDADGKKSRSPEEASSLHAKPMIRGCRTPINIDLYYGGAERLGQTPGGLSPAGGGFASGAASLFGSAGGAAGSGSVASHAPGALKSQARSAIVLKGCSGLANWTKNCAEGGAGREGGARGVVPGARSGAGGDDLSSQLDRAKGSQVGAAPSAAAAAAAAAAKDDSLQWCHQQIQQVIRQHPEISAAAAKSRGYRPLFHQSVLAEAAMTGGIGGMAPASPSGAWATYNGAGAEGAGGWKQWREADVISPAPQLEELLVVLAAAVKVHVAELMTLACAAEAAEYAARDLQGASPLGADVSNLPDPTSSSAFAGDNDRPRRVLCVRHILAAAAQIPALD